MGKKQINVEVDEEIANYVKRQAHQGRYIEDLVRRDMGADDSLLRRIEVLEHAVHENYIRFDGLDFEISSSGWSSVMGHISKFRFNIKDPMENMEIQTMADGLTLRTFAFRNSEGHFAGKARIIFKQNETNPFILDFESISRIGGRLIVPLE